MIQAEFSLASFSASSLLAGFAFLSGTPKPLYAPGLASILSIHAISLG